MFIADNTAAHRPISGLRTLAACWLPSDGSHPQGDVPAEFVDRLEEILARRGTTVALTRGSHRCELCPTNVPDRPRSSAELWLFAAMEDEVVLYQMPRLIGHYVSAHGYVPPQPLIDAVLTGDACVVTGDDLRTRMQRRPELVELTNPQPSTQPNPVAAHAAPEKLRERDLDACGVRYIRVGDATGPDAIFAGTSQEFGEGFAIATPANVLAWAMREGPQVTFLPSAPANP